MLRRFISIKNVGTFVNHAFRGESELRKLSLVHGDNGRGKSTLCALLRSLRSGDNNLVLERTTLGSEEPPYVRLLIDETTIDFTGGAWQVTYPNLEIFDADFVTQNVYSGDAITHDHKCNLCRVVLGAEGVALAEKLVELDGEERTAGTILTATRADVQRLAPAGMTADAFVDLAADVQIDVKIEETQRKIAVAESADSIARRAVLSEIRLPTIPANLEAVLGKTIEGVSAEAERRVREHIERHVRYPRGPESWLGAGLNNVVDNTCPFCAQSLDNSPIFGAVSEYFSDAYRGFQTELSTFRTEVRQPLSAEALIEVQRTSTANITNWEFWQRFLRIYPTLLTFDVDIQPAFTAAREAIEPLIEAKSATPLEAIPLTVDAIAALQRIGELQARVTSQNEEIREINQAIARTKADAGARNATALQQQLAALLSQKSRHTPETATVVSAFTDAKDAKRKIEEAKEAARQALDAYNAQVIGSYHDAVNDLLVRFGAAFKLATVKVEYTGRTPRAAYSFEIRGKEVEPGSDRTPAGTPCFRNTLSAGDRSTLALAFFIAQLKNRGDLADLIVVLDDPFTSLDSFRQHWTCTTIRKIAEQAKQVIVMSHSLNFLRLVKEDWSAAQLRTLELGRHNARDSHIIHLDLDDATAAQVERDINELRRFCLDGVGDHAATIRRIRPVMENHIRKMAPDQCPEGSGWLGSFLGNIRQADAASPLAQFIPMYDDLNALNGYTSPYMHDPDHAEPINAAELTAQSRLTLQLIGR